MFELIGGIRGIIAALVGAALMFGAMSILDLVDDASVAREARSKQLAQFEAQSAKALTNALLMAGKAQADAISQADREQIALTRWHESETDRMEAEIDALETDLASRDRACLLDRSDIDRMRNASPKANPGG